MFRGVLKPGPAVCAILALLCAARLDGQTSSPELSSRAAFDDALGRHMYGEAEVIAKTSLARALTDGRREELATADLYSDLAEAQRLGGAPEAARRNYELAIDVIEAQTDMLNLRLERPLYGLAMAELDSWRPDLAVRHFDRAIHVRQVSDGPHNIAQLKSLQMQGRAYVRLGNPGSATDVADRIGYLLDRHEANLGAEVVEMLLEQGDLYRAAGQPALERETYAHAATIVSARGDLDASLLVEPLIRTGESHTRQYYDEYFAATEEEQLPDRQMLSEGRSRLARAYALADDLATTAWELKHRASIALGDFYTLTGNFSNARQKYRESWRLLSDGPARLDRRKQDLESVVPLLQPSPEPDWSRVDDLAPDERRESESSGYITTRFTVTRRGRVADARLVEIAPARDERLEAKMKESLAKFVFRPRIEGGFLVDTPGRTVTYRFPTATGSSAKRD